MNLFIKYPTILFIAQSFISFSPVAQTSNPTSSSAAAYYLEGNMMEANMQYGALLSVEPDNIDFPQGLSFTINQKKNQLLFCFSNEGDLRKLISTVDEVLEHVNLSMEVIK